MVIDLNDNVTLTMTFMLKITMLDILFIGASIYTVKRQLYRFKPVSGDIQLS